MLCRKTIAFLLILVHICNGHVIISEFVETLPYYNVVKRINALDEFNFEITEERTSKKLIAGDEGSSDVRFLKVQIAPSGFNGTIHIYNLWDTANSGVSKYEHTVITVFSSDRRAIVVDIPYFEAIVVLDIQGLMLPSAGYISYVDVSKTSASLDSSLFESYSIVTDLDVYPHRTPTLKSLGNYDYILVICLEDDSNVYNYGDTMAMVSPGETLHLHSLLQEIMSGQKSGFQFKVRFLVIPRFGQRQYGNALHFKIEQEAEKVISPYVYIYVAIAFSIFVPTLLLVVTKGCTKFPSSFGGQEETALEDVGPNTENIIPNDSEEIAIPVPNDEAGDIVLIPAAATVDG